jgi:hypothetical protein
VCLGPRSYKLLTVVEDCFYTPRSASLSWRKRSSLTKGVEIGQLLALGAILIAMGYWRRTNSFLRHAYTANVIMMIAGFILIGYQLTGYFVS